MMCLGAAPLLPVSLGHKDVLSENFTVKKREERMRGFENMVKSWMMWLDRKEKDGRKNVWEVR